MRNKLSDVFYSLSKFFGYYINLSLLLCLMISSIFDGIIFLVTGNRILYFNEMVGRIIIASILVSLLIATIFFGLSWIFEDEEK